jgi:hypothetical protein
VGKTTAMSSIHVFYKATFGRFQLPCDFAKAVAKLYAKEQEEQEKDDGYDSDSSSDHSESDNQQPPLFHRPTYEPVVFEISSFVKHDEPNFLLTYNPKSPNHWIRHQLPTVGFPWNSGFRATNDPAVVQLFETMDVERRVGVRMATIDESLLSSLFLYENEGEERLCFNRSRYVLDELQCNRESNVNFLDYCFDKMVSKVKGVDVKEIQIL